MAPHICWIVGGGIWPAAQSGQQESAARKGAQGWAPIPACGRRHATPLLMPSCLQQGRKGAAVAVPEEVGSRGACALLDEVHRGGVCDSAHQARPPPSLHHTP